MKKKLLWILWTPLILIGLVLVTVFVVYLVGYHNTEYGPDDYQIAAVNYENLDRFEVTDRYELLVRDKDLLSIAEKFNGYVKMILGKELNVTNKKTKSPVIELAVNENNGSDYTFSSDNRNIKIVADNKAHLLRGVYDFLEQFGGIKCYTSKMIKTTSDKITFPKKKGGYVLDYNEYFEMRDTDWMSSKDDEYSRFRGFNTDVYRFEISGQQADETDEQAKQRIDKQTAYYESMGDRTQYISGFCHTFTADFLNSTKYYDKGENLECYALDSKGNRRRDELCLSNPKTFEIVKDEVFEILENKRETHSVSGKKYKPNAPLQIISLTQSDDLTGCKCDECVKCAKEHGGYSAPNLLFVNKIAQAVKDAGYDNVAIDTFAYRYTRSAPTDIVPLDNVIIRLCTIECCASHYIDDEKCLANKAFMKDLADWSKICGRIYIWDYCTDFSYFEALFPNLNAMAHNIRIYYEHNVKGIYEEGNYTLDPNNPDPEFAELRSYLISKVMQNPYCDYDAVIKEFCDGYYGEAGEYIYQFITKADTYAARKHINIYMKPSAVLKCSKAELTELNDLFEQAKNAATGEALENVKSSELCWRYYKMYKKLFEFSKRRQYENETERLYFDLAKRGITKLHEVEDNYIISGIAQSAIVELRLLFDFVVGNFVYGP